MRSLSLATLLCCSPALAQDGPADTATLEAVQIIGIGEAPGHSLGLNAPQQVGSRLGLTPRETPASISVLSAQDIADRNLFRAQDAAARMPGISEAPAPGNGGTSLTARGFAGHNSVAQLVDGTRLVVASGTVSYPFSTWPLESVEVLRGPASVLYGDGAIGAAVNYVTKKPIWHDTQRETFVGTGSHGLAQGGVGLRGPINDAVAYSLYVDGKRSDGYRALDGVNRRNYALALSVKPLPRLTATFSLDGGVNNDARYFGTPLRNGKYDDSLKRINYNVADAVVRYDDRIWRAKLDYEVSPHVRLRNETYYLTSKRHWRNAETYTLDAASASVLRDDYLEIRHDQEQTGNRLDMTMHAMVAGLPNRLVVGLDWYRVNMLHTNNSPYGGASVVDAYDFDRGDFLSPTPTRPGRRARMQTTALFLENALDLTPSWKLVGGLRHERMQLNNNNLRSGVRQDKSYAPTTGRLGLVWAASDTVSFYGQYATGTDPLSGSLSLPGGGTSFDLTRGRQVEAGVKGVLPSLRGEWTLAVYRIQKRNLLSRDPGDPTATRQVGRQSSTGIELALAMEPVRGWIVDANLALLRARYDDFNEITAGSAVSRDGNVPTGVPQRMANLWSTWQVSPQWKLATGVRYVGQRPTSAGNSRWLPSYTVLDAGLTYEYSSRLNFTLSVRNLADRAYAVSGSDSDWLLGAPRTILLTSRATF